MKCILMLILGLCVAFGAENNTNLNSQDSVNQNANQSADSSESNPNDAQNPALINAIKSAVEKRFLDYYKKYNITINNLEIAPVIERNLAKYRLEKIIFDDRDLRKDSGNFEVHIRHNERKKRVFFNFQINAIIDSLSAVGSIKSGEVIDKNNTMIAQIPLTKNLTLPVSAEILGEYEAKSFIAGGASIVASKITPKIIVRKGDILSVAYKNSDINITFSVKATQDGAKGQTIRAQNSQSGKALNVIIVDSKNAKILE
ncbi:flagellar basal body P-ring formation chaperone FlgA [Helicobacter sp. 23-1045]